MIGKLQFDLVIVQCFCIQFWTTSIKGQSLCPENDNLAEHLDSRYFPTLSMWAPKFVMKITLLSGSEQHIPRFFINNITFATFEFTQFSKILIIQICLINKVSKAFKLSEFAQSTKYERMNAFISQLILMPAVFKPSGFTQSRKFSWLLNHLDFFNKQNFYSIKIIRISWIKNI